MRRNNDESNEAVMSMNILTGEVWAWFSLRCCVFPPTKATTECLDVRTKPQYESDLNADTLRSRVISKE